MKKRDWSLYNQAKTQEMYYFTKILTALASCVDYGDFWHGEGRPPIEPRVMVVCSGIKVYQRMSNRRTISHLWLLRDTCKIKAIPHFNTVGNFLKNPRLYYVLQDLIALSATPVKNIEYDFSIDSTGFGTPNTEKWIDIRTRKESDRKKYRKLHAVTGNLTNMITSACVTPGEAGDSPELKALAQKTAKTFHIMAFEGDSAYLSRDNCNTVAELGGFPFFLPRSNTTSKAGGSWTWRRMIRLFQEDEELFRKYYHKRSNSESSFSGMKGTFGGYVVSKSEIAQDNEILLKVLNYNILQLIRAMFELNVDLEEILIHESEAMVKRGYTPWSLSGEAELQQVKV